MSWLSCPAPVAGQLQLGQLVHLPPLPIDSLQADTVRHSKDSQPPFARIPAPASPQVEPTLPSTDWEILWGGGTARCITCRQRATQLLSCFAYTIMPEGSSLSPSLPTPVFTASSCVMEEAKVQNGMKTGQMGEWDVGEGGAHNRASGWTNRLWSLRRK